MKDLGPHNAMWLGDGEWLSWDDFGEFDPDEPQSARLPELEWEADMLRRHPHAELPVVRQFVRLARASSEYHETTGKHLMVYGALGELYGAMVWGVHLHRRPDTAGSDGRMGSDFVEIKTIGPRSRSARVRVSLKGNFSRLLVVKIEAGTDDGPCAGFRIAGRLVERRALTSAATGHAGISWSRACRIGQAPPTT